MNENRSFFMIEKDLSFQKDEGTRHYPKLSPYRFSSRMCCFPATAYLKLCGLYHTISLKDVFNSRGKYIFILK